MRLMASIFLPIFGIFLYRDIMPTTKNFKINHEIQILMNRLVKKPAVDLMKYELFCSNYGFKNQCSSSHYLYNKLDPSKLMASEDYMLSLYLALKNNLSNMHLVTKPYQTKSNKIEAAIHQAVIGDALGFVVENEPTVASIAHHFPEGVVEPKSLSDSLKTHRLSTKYGQYNNNNLNANGKIIYSDDTELSIIVLHSALKSYKKDPLNINLFINELTNNLTWHWYSNLKLSGKYGEDGLYYGTRGYGKKVLQALSDLYNHKPLEGDNLNNGSLIRAWPLGLVPYDSYKTAAIMAAKQSLITNQSLDVAVACGAMAAGVHVSIYDSPKSKMEVVNKMINIAQLLEKTLIPQNSNHDKNLLVSTYLQYAKTAALEDINPIIFYNAAIGYHAQETVSAVVFSFLRHKYFLTALIESSHIPGDSDSVASLTSALMGAYHGITSFPEEYTKYIETPALTLQGDVVSMYSLVDDITANF